jgi:site-specific DNA recombinase
VIAAIYARKSTKQDDTAESEKSVTTQITNARAFAAQKGWQVGPIFEDNGISGALFGKNSKGGEQRPGFATLMRASSQRPLPFGALIMMETARLGRDAVATASALKEITEAGIEVWTYLDGAQHKMDSAMDTLLFNIKGFGDQDEREKASARTHSALAEKFARGHHVGGRVYGYRNVDVMGDTLDKHGRVKRSHVILAPIPAEAAVVCRIFERFAAGAGLKRIATGLTADHILSPRGSSWDPSAIREILRRPLYHGVAVWNRTRSTTTGGRDGQAPRLPAEWQEHPAEHLRLVPEALWLAVAARVAQSEEAFARKGNGSFFAKASKTDFASPYLMTGFLRCACGGALGGQVALHGNGPASARRRVTKYGCTFFKNRGALACSNSLTLKTETLDETVLMAIREIIAPDMLTVALDRALSVLAAGQDGYVDTRAALDAKVTAAEATTARLVAAIGAGGAELQPLLDGLTAAEATKATLRAELAAMPPMPPVIDPADILATLTARASDLVGLLAVEHGPKTRALMRKLLPAPLVATPTETADGRKGFHLAGRVSLLGLLDGDVADLLTRPNNTPSDGGPNGIRTRVSALRGPCPGPLDDGATSAGRGGWLGEEESNLHYGVQSPASYH